MASASGHMVIASVTSVTLLNLTIFQVPGQPKQLQQCSTTYQQDQTNIKQSIAFIYLRSEFSLGQNSFLIIVF